MERPIDRADLPYDRGDSARQRASFETDNDSPQHCTPGARLNRTSERIPRSLLRGAFKRAARARQAPP